MLMIFPGMVSRSVSIHAPARGATWPLQLRREKVQVSIHAPARGATGRIFHIKMTINVSIHAPARGATYGVFSSQTWEASFNPRAREGRDNNKRQKNSSKR